MQLIKSLSEIDYKNSAPLNFLATVISVDGEGDAERKKPFKATLKLEESGEIFQIYSWKFENLQTYKDLVFSTDVYKFEAIPSLYRDTEKQIRVGEISNAGLKSSKKILKITNVEEIKREIEKLVNTYIPENSSFVIYKRIIETLVFNNDKFWTWPAATKMHHAYPGGLAKHTLNTVKNAISTWQTYNGSNLSIALVVAGAVLHDIGKISEYNLDGSRTIYGNLVPHPIAGYSKVFNTALQLGADPEKDTKLIMLLHIILSHHEKLEYGAPTQPCTLEALIVARADALDAVFEAADTAIDSVEVNVMTDRLMAIDGTKMFKWHN